MEVHIVDICPNDKLVRNFKDGRTILLYITSRAFLGQEETLFVVGQKQNRELMDKFSLPILRRGKTSCSSMSGSPV